MSDFFMKIVPVILVFLLGWFLRKTDVLKNENGDVFLKLAFYAAVPASILLSVSKIPLTVELAYLPLAAIILVLAVSSIAYLAGKALKLPRATLGTFIVGATIMNIGFTLPFFIAAYGEEGLARASLFDFGNGLLTFTYVYFIACRFGPHAKSRSVLIKRFVASPPLWALVIALLLNVTRTAIPAVAGNFLQLIGNMTIPLIMLALGVTFAPKMEKFRTVFAAAFIRFVVGLAFGFLLVAAFRLEGLSRLIVLIGSSAPIGYNTLTFSSMEELDKDFAASLVSFGILVGIIFIPLEIFLFS